jgi:hypothetical protein
MNLALKKMMKQVYKLVIYTDHLKKSHNTSITQVSVHWTAIVREFHEVEISTPI